MGKNPDLKRQGVSFPAGKLPAAELARMLARHTRQDGRVVVMPGIGKDATVISFAGQYLVAKTDPITFATDQIGWYVVHVNANDVAAMGGIPRWFLATLLLPEGKTGPEEVEAAFAQISGACQEVGAVLCGGHTEITYGLERPIIVGQMLGEVEKEKLIVPDRIRPGDKILMTKGLAIEGTAILVGLPAEQLIVMLQRQVIFILGIILIGAEDGCRIDKAGYVVHMPVRVVPGNALLEPDDLGDAQVFPEIALDLFSA